jgi:hypothetical protein
MNFPIHLPVFQFLYMLVNLPGLGGLAVALVAAGSILAYTLTLRWIARGSDVEEAENYSYPTPALTHQQR